MLRGLVAHRCCGLDQITGTLHLSESTVKTYHRTLFEKLGVSRRAHGVALALRYQLID